MHWQSLMLGSNMWRSNMKMSRLKYLCLFVLGFCIGFYSQKAMPVSLIDSAADDTTCMAMNIYFEAGNQPLAGKIAVGHVTLNRVKDSQFPSSICAVVHQTKEYKTSWKTGELIPRRGMCQFSWFCDGKADIPLDSVTWIESIYLARRILAGEWTDITEGALWYHADYTTPYWIKNLNRTVYINNHIFYK